MITGKKDAIHQPIIICRVGRKTGLTPGQKVTVSPVGFFAYSVEDSNYHGIVDPFLEEDAIFGEAVRVFIKPGIVTDLTHSFSTPWDTDTTDLSPEYYDECRGCD